MNFEVAHDKYSVGISSRSPFWTRPGSTLMVTSLYGNCLDATSHIIIPKEYLCWLSDRFQLSCGDKDTCPILSKILAEQRITQEPSMLVYRSRLQMLLISTTNVSLSENIGNNFHTLAESSLTMANPKSASLQFQFLSSNTFADFKSR